MIIKNTTVINFYNLKVQKNVNVKIKGNTIESINEEKFIQDTFEEVIDGSNYYLIPGLVNAHAHTSMALLRGSSEDTTSTEWFNEHIWIYEQNIKKDDVYFGTLLGAIEMISSGITTVFDHYFNLDEAYKAYKELGMRADLSYTMFGSGVDKEKNFKAAMDFIEKYENTNELITISLGPHSPYVCPKEFLEEVYKIQQETQLKVHIHISEEPWQIEKSLKNYGLTPIKYLDSLGLLSDKTILAHAYFATGEELELIKAREANIAHAPKTYLRFAWVNDLINRVIKKGVHLTFATDGAASNGNYSIFEVARLSAMLGKIASNSPKEAKVEDVVKFFSEGEHFLKKPIGKIEAGYLADIVFLDRFSPRLAPEESIFANLLYAISEQDIKKVMINGKIIFEDNKIFGYNKEEIVKKANEIGRRLRKKKSDSPMQTFG